MSHVNSDIRFSIIPEWILDSDISDRAIRVYCILARYADSETLQAFPSRETLAKRAHCHYKSIDRAIDELVKIGAIVKRHRKSGESYQSNLYTLRRVRTALSLPTDTGDEGVRTPVSPGTDTVVHLTRTNELEPVNDTFARFWSTYPRKVGKQAAQRAFEKAISKYDVNVILEGLDRMVADSNLPDKQFLPHPSTWLNEGRWEDEAYPERERDGRPLKPAAQVPGHRDWVRVEHDAGEHWACRPGEFGCK